MVGSLISRGWLPDGWENCELSPIAVADAAHVFSKLILNDVNSLHSITLNFCEPFFIPYMYGTNLLSR